MMPDHAAQAVLPASTASPDASPEFLARVPHAFARSHLVLGVNDPVADDGPTGMTFLHATSTDPLVLHNLRVDLGGADGDGPSWVARVADGEVLARWIDSAYAGPGAGARPAVQGVAHEVIELTPGRGESSQAEAVAALAAAGERDLLTLADKGPVVRFVDGVIFDAIARGASDIHIQPLGEATLVRYRLDGVLLTARRLPPSLALPVVSRIKVMARLDVAERRAPQDGRATVTLGSTVKAGNARAVDLRISTLPSSYGERVVIRLLDTHRGRALAALDALGMPGPIEAAFRERSARAAGMILVTGPTGSGKTTTLYATLRWIGTRASSSRRAADLNVLTIEDPIEYDLSAVGADARGADGGELPISQTQVDPRKGLTFATGLRHILRQDPDVIMVGEVRDLETARIAIQASLTGHLVFSTLHTADAPGAVTRLSDLGIEPYLVASSLSCVLAQRLVRVLHRGPDGCGGAGCEACLGSGFRGRRGIFELLVVDAIIRDLIADRATASVIRDSARARGMQRLEDHGRALVHEGLTTLDEVRRVSLGVD